MDCNKYSLSTLSKPSKVLNNVRGSLRVEAGSGFIREQDFWPGDKLNRNLNRSAVLYMSYMEACTHGNSFR